MQLQPFAYHQLLAIRKKNRAKENNWRKLAHTKIDIFSLIIFLLRFFYLAYGNLELQSAFKNWNKLKIAPLFFEAVHKM